jgi:hypothetical protein
VTDQPFDPTPFRRAEVLRRLLAAARDGRDVDPDAGLSPEARAVRAETRRLVAEALPEAPTPEEEDAIITACYRRAVRLVARKQKRRQAGRAWGK